ncbi:protein of unknown function [Streptococcus thermophilus]|nr:protein of unknown function [Streptococcus thermophilus]CAD0149744.1 protein of unknown function [Streptococcus thermophilus]
MVTKKRVELAESMVRSRRFRKFIYVDQSTEMSQRLEGSFHEWIEVLPNQQLKQVYDLFFNTILDSGIESLDDFGIKTLPKLGQLLQEFGNLTDQQKRFFKTVSTSYSGYFGSQETRNIVTPS